MENVSLPPNNPARPWFLPSLVAPFLALFFALPAAISSAQTAPATAPQNRFEKDVKTYEAADQKEAPPKGAILLAGDSQFFRWKTFHEDLPGFTVVNRGIDSFETSDLVHFAERLVIPYKPRFIVLHTGGNDVHNGKPPTRVLADFKAFVALVRAAQPDVPIAFTSLTPSPARWSEAEKRKETNKLLKDYVASEKNMFFIDLWDAMLTPDGKPREDIWGPDRIHPNHDGYLIRVKAMLPILGPPDSPIAPPK